MPSADGWVHLTVPASDLGLEGLTVDGISFALSDGGAAFNRIGKISSGSTETVWFDDGTPPAGADLSYVTGNDQSWGPSASSPAPVSGNVDFQLSNATGLHQIWSYNSQVPLDVATGDVLFAYVWLDPMNTPSEVMLGWVDGSGTWTHNAYWGLNQILSGVGDSDENRYMGELPATGGWVRLAVPAALVGLEGGDVTAMAFLLYGGSAALDQVGVISTSTSDNGQTTSYLYDADNRLIAAQDPIAAAAGTDTQFGYDADGNLISTTDALGNVTTYAFNARNELVGMTDPANEGTGHEDAYTYDDAGNLMTVTDPRGNITTYGYDGDNRVTSVTDAMSNVTTYVYDGDGELSSFTDANFNPTTLAFNSTTYTYDSLGQLQTETETNDDGGTTTTTYTYDHDGDLTGVTDGNDNTTTYTYDPADRLSAVTDANDHTTTYTFDGDGNAMTVTDPLSHTTTYVYDDEDRQVSETDPTGGGTTTYTYDDFGNLLTVTDPDSNTTTYTYDLDNRQTTETSPTSGVTTYAYDLVGNLVETVDPDGHTITYSYDDDDRPTGETWVNPLGGTPLDVFTTTYDVAGNVTSTDDNNSNITYSYDVDNRLLSETVTDPAASDVPAVTLTYGYDGVGNTSSLSDNLDGLISYTYNARNELSSESQSGSGEHPASIDFTYDDAGNMMGQTDNSDAYSEDAVLSTSYTYDPANNLTGITDRLPDTTVVASYAYTLDAADRLMEETRTWASGMDSDTTDYTYKNNNQLTGVTHTDTSFANESFDYDPNGNRNTTGYATDPGNELHSDGTYDYGYDANGNMISQTDIASGDETIYTYDYRNRLVEVQQVVGETTTVVAQYTYDALNRRIDVSEGGSTTWTLYDGTSTDALIDFDDSGDVTARYLYGPSPAGVDAVLGRDTPTGGVAWYLADRLGSVGDIVDNSGTVIDHVDYTAFGTPTDSAPSAGDQFKFAGMRYDAVIGEYYDESRWYDPAAGRFISQDPLQFNSSDANFYRYVYNSSTNAFDSDGLAPEFPIPVGNPNAPNIDGVGKIKLSPPDLGKYLLISNKAFKADCPGAIQLLQQFATSIAQRYKELDPRSPTYQSHLDRINAEEKIYEELQRRTFQSCGASVPTPLRPRPRQPTIGAPKNPGQHTTVPLNPTPIWLYPPSYIPQQPAYTGNTLGRTPAGPMYPAPHFPVAPRIPVIR